jgi:hypothetical protein
MPCIHSAAARLPRWLLLVLPLLAVSLSAAPRARSTDTADISSAWRAQPIRIDGNDEDWYGLTSPVKGQRFAVGLLNDSDAIYLCLVTKDRVLTTQIERQGLMIWLDPAGAKKRSFGIQFPIDPWLEAMRDTGRRPRQAIPEGASLPEDVGQGTVGILGAGKSGPKRVPMEEAGGIAARLAVRGDVLVYEMRIPLKGSQPGPYAVNAEPGSSLRLELQTPEWRGPMPVARGRIAIGAAGPAPGGRGVIGYPPIDGAMLKPMDTTVTVRLATAMK